MRFLEQAQLAAGFLPVDMSAGANNGDWVSLEKFNHVAIVFYKAGGTAGDDPTLTIQQARDAVGSGAKNLPFTRIYRKQGSDLQTVGQWTVTEQTANHQYTNDTSAEQQLFWVVEFDASELDVNNGFKFVRATVADVGANAQLGCLLYVLTEPRYADAVDKMPSVLS